MNVGRIKTHGWMALAFLLFFMALFIQFPLQGSLPQNIDTWFNLATFNDLGNRINAWWDGRNTGTYFYLLPTSYTLGEPSFGSGLFFLLLKGLGLNDIWTYFLFISLVYALNAFGMYMFSFQVVKNAFAAVYAAFVFSACNYSFALIDNQNAIVYFPLLFCMYYLARYTDEAKSKYFIASVILFSLQIYFSTYVFLFCGLCVLLWAIIFWKRIPRVSFILFTGVMAFFLASSGLFYHIMEIKDNAQLIPGKEFILKPISLHSIHAADFIRALPGNLFMPVKEDIISPWRYNSRAIYIGFSVFLLAVLGFVRADKYHRGFGLLLFVLALVVSLGPFSSFLGKEIKMPLYAVYNNIDISLFFRHPSRAYMLVVLATAMLAGFGIMYLQQRLKSFYFFWAVLLLFFLLENIPFKMRTFPSDKYLHAPQVWKYVAKDSSIPVVVNLPSSISFEDNIFSGDLNTYNREYIYMYWQTQLKYNTINGISGYIPGFRFTNDRWVRDIKDPNNLDSLIYFNRLDYILWHKAMLLPSDSLNALLFLNNSDRLSKVFADESIVIYKIKDKSVLHISE